jgi:DNA (cytosine-5)-methyltransferase 1
VLVLSLFPGIGLLDMAFEQEGFTVVRGPDVLWGGDIRRFHPPAGKFDGVIGGPPCQRHSTAAPIRRGLPADCLISDFERCVTEAEPMWFLMENVRRAPIPNVPGYEVASYLVNNRWFGQEQQRLRRFSFGFRGPRVPLLIEPAIKMAAKVLRTVTASDGKRNGRGTNLSSRRETLTGQVLSFAETCAAQGLPADFLAKSPLTKEGRYRVVGNGVPLPMGRAIARAVREASSSG